MKTNVKQPALILIAVLLIAAFATCSKEKIGNRQSPLIQHRLGGCEVYVDLVCENTIPHYASVQAFEDAYDCLETDYESYNTAYESTYSTLTDNQFDEQVDDDQFNEEEPLDDWESIYSYVSLRTYLTGLEDTWLAGGMIGADPFDHAVADFIFMTLLNADGDVQIGSDLYHFAANGDVTIVFGGDCDVFEDAKSNSEYTHESLQRIFNIAIETCQYTEYEKGRAGFINDANRRCEWRVDFDSYVSNSRAKTTVRNFKLKNGNWKRSPAKTRVRIEGQVWNNECLQSGLFSYKEKTARRKRLGARRTIPSFAKIKTAEVFGEVEQINDGLEIDTTIVW